MTQPFSPPPIQPFERLQVTDGLLMTADRWRQAHDYHRRRQNVHYQALNQPGIVCGLGVHRIAPPPNLPPKFQEERWVQIQPGLAIDLQGNLIVVAEPIDFFISTRIMGNSPLTVYLVLSYVDPDELNRSESQELVQETFRIDEKNSPPEEQEIEVCRILLLPDTTELQETADVFFPAPNQLDFRYRRSVQARPQATVRLAQLVHSDPNAHYRFEQLNGLTSAIAALYPALSTTPAGQVPLPVNPHSEANQYDLLYLTGTSSPFAPGENEKIRALEAFLSAGGTLLVDVPPSGAELAKGILWLAHQLNTPLEYLDRLNRSHPLRTQPFLFSALPQLSDQPLQVMIGGGIVLVLGDVAAGWGLDPALALPRETIRAAQEFGVNLLHFAYQRRSRVTLGGKPATHSRAPIDTPLSGQTPLPNTPLPTSARREESVRKRVSDTLAEL